MIKLLERIVLRLNLIEAKKTKACPTPTRDVNLNLKNRNKAIKQQAYGPANPALPNRQFWKEKAEMWDNIPVSEAESMRCGNCAAFDVSKRMKNCIQTGLKDGAKTDSYDTINAGQLGYCHMLKFKCAAKRTCDAWVTGGPIREMNEGVFSSVSPGRLDPYLEPDTEIDVEPESASRPEALPVKWKVTARSSIWKEPTSIVEIYFPAFWKQDEWSVERNVPVEELSRYQDATVQEFDDFNKALEYVKGVEVASGAAITTPSPGGKPSKLSPAGRDQLVKSEGMRRRVYDDKQPLNNDGTEKHLCDFANVKGYPTIAAGKKIYPQDEPYFSQFLCNGRDMTDAELYQFVKEPVEEREPILTKLLTGPTNQAQYDALFHMMYNTGHGDESFKLALRYHNKGKYEEAKQAIHDGNDYSRGKFSRGLRKRREREAKLYGEASGIP